MPNPRRKVDFTGIEQERVTYRIDGATITFDPAADYGSPLVGRAVELSADETVALANDNGPVHGRLELVEADGMCVVTTDGYVTLPGGQGATLTPGRPIVGALGAAGARGHIKQVAPAADTPTQADVNAAALGRGRIVRAGDPTKVVVRL